jgi:hypothetical protein
VHARTENNLREAVPAILAAHVWSEEAVAPLPLFYGIITGESAEN